MSTVQRSLVLVKPDGVRRGLSGEVLRRIEAKGYTLAAVALGFVVPAMFGLGAVFAALWVGADLLGRKIERERAAAWAAYDAEQSG